MAPGLVLEGLKELDPNSTVLDPMAGSGTVLRQAIDLGHIARGFDLDPLAVLMAKVWTTPVSAETIDTLYEKLKRVSEGLDPDDIRLPWIDDDEETTAFVEYWFADKQRAELRCLAYAIDQLASNELTDVEAAALDVLRLNVSRIIVTKEQAASLARDTSHSRPHKVASVSEYDVVDGYERSLKQIKQRLTETPPAYSASVSLGDARNLQLVETASVDAVFTSPPYLNAIDYLRGHRLALVWLGKRLSELRTIRSDSIGAERALEDQWVDKAIESVARTIVAKDALPPRYQRMVDRYARDLAMLMGEVRRALKPSGLATLVVGNSCLKGTFIDNAGGVVAAASALGLCLAAKSERELPQRSRYLPVSGGALDKRMRTETVLSFSVA
jgi:adenine-specific DNA methylase